MNAQMLRPLLSQNEGLKLDFKKEYKIRRIAPSGQDRQMWSQLIQGQWDELLKDVIALANGNVGVSNDTAYLIIGAEDSIDNDGTRRTHDMSNMQIDTRQVLDKLSNACTPPIPDISCEPIVIDGTTLYVISIPPTPYVHESNRQLRTMLGNIDANGTLVSVNPDKIYTEYTAFIRKGDIVSAASMTERRALEQDKGFDLVALQENLRFELMGNLKSALSRIGDEVKSASYFYQPFKQNYTIEINKPLRVKGQHLIWLVIALVQARTPEGGLARRFIEQAISSQRFLSYNPNSGKYESTEFLRYLYELLQNMDRFESAARHLAIERFITRYSHLQSHRDEYFSVEFFDIVFVAGMLDRYENVVTLSVALFRFLMGDRAAFESLTLNPMSPIRSEDTNLQAELLTDNDVFAWLENER